MRARRNTYVSNPKNKNMNAIVKIPKLNNDRANSMLRSVITSCTQPSLVNEDNEYFNVKLFNCWNKIQLNERLDYLCEASGIDFKYQFSFIT